MRRLLLCLGLLTSVMPLVAQVRVCMGGNLDTLSTEGRRSCEAQVVLAREAALRNNVPSDWHFVVVCGEDGWKDYMAFSATGETALKNVAADVDMANRTTFLRGTRLLTQEASDLVLLQAFRQQPSGIQIAQR